MLRELARRLGTVTPKHPVPMRTTFRDCFLVNFLMDPATLARVLPPPLEPDLAGGRAFLSVVIADMDRMRPAFLPAVCGVTYRQVVYRAVVRCGPERGVHFLCSDADNRLMVFMGNLLSFFSFHEARIIGGRSGRKHHIDLATAPDGHANIHASFDLASASRTVPAGSVFPSFDEAQAFLVELYAAFHPQAGESAVSTVRIKRGAWHISFVDAPRARFAFMDGSAAFPAGSTRVDSVMYVEDIEYSWQTLDRPGIHPLR